MDTALRLIAGRALHQLEMFELLPVSWTRR